MPVYVYVCKDCGTVKEVEHGYNDEPEILCDSCGKPMKRRIGNVGFVLKGSGWARKSQQLEQNKIPEEVWNNAEKQGLV